MYIRGSNHPEYIAEIKLCIEQNYNFVVSDLKPAQRGSYGDTWYIVVRETKYFVKIQTSTCILDRYRNSLEVIYYLKDKGITFINGVIHTKNGTLYVEFNDGIMAVFDYIEGEQCNGKEMYLLRPNVYELLAQIYQIPVGKCFSEHEDFSVKCAEYVLNQINEYDLLLKYHIQIEEYFSLLKMYSNQCKDSKHEFYFTHGDVANNLLVYHKQLVIVDWDTLKMAYPERDVWFMIHSKEDLHKIEEVFKHQGFIYHITKNKLMYYCLYSYFSYLKDHIVNIKETKDSRKKRLLMNYIHRYFFHSFINYQIAFLSELE